MPVFIKHNRWALLWGFFIIGLTSIPGEVLPTVPKLLDLFQPDKILHVVVFGVYIFLQISGLKTQQQYRTLQRNAVWISLAVGLFLGAATELLQHFVIPMRRGSPYDFLANAAGCFLGYLLWQRYGHSFRKWS